MLNQTSPAATIGVKDISTAKNFYEGKLGLTPLGPPLEEEVQVYKSGNTVIEVYKSKYAGTNQATALTWHVQDIESEVQELKKKGISFEHYDFPDTRMEGDIHVMGDMKAAWFKDPDGNILGLVNVLLQ